MDVNLVVIIHCYQYLSQKMVKRVLSHFEICPSQIVSNITWFFLDIEPVGKTSCGIKYSKHGIGLRMETDHIDLDFDFGGAGELDGFDPWKIWKFIEANKIKCPYKSFKEIYDLFIQAEKEGKLVVDNSVENLYYFVCDNLTHEANRNKNK